MVATDSTIAIDGPGAVGKTTIGRLLAQRLGFLLVDTGNMYRALTAMALGKGISADDEEALEQLAQETDIRFTSGKSGSKSREKVIVGGRDLTENVKRPEVDLNVSSVAKHPGVRKAMVAQQRRLASEGEIIMVGRDIGTVVIPDAKVKVFLTASVEERARRRYLELSERGYSEDYAAILKSLEDRDRIDSERDVSPLRPAEDAKLIDTDSITPQQVVDRILEAWESS